MNTGVCPRCGATLTDGRCLKCNPSATPPEISQSFVKPVSYIARAGSKPGTMTRPVSPPVPSMQDAVSIQKLRERNKRQTRFITAGILVLLILGGYEVY